MFLLLLLSTIQALSTGLDGGKELCLGVQGKKTALFQISFVVSGFQEDNIEMKFYSPRKTLLKSSIKQKEGNYKEIMTDDGQYEVCFKSLDKYYKLISFNFDFVEENDLALAETMDQMAEEMKQAYRSLKTIQNNQHYQNDRENEHQRMLESTEKKLWWCSAGKMGALIVICISQIYMLTGYFKGKSFGPNV
ncbi:unnamed protein product [Paramecium primaurelia]|uniref:GOLD domain-containing protein n=3 Tax=Paramecium TaxID=5884 RepID=A0A8S1TAV3_9CILI|nr:unnamed protein product [Paramecium primaurelia]CAD8148419.1 unnamed protein product [Paramecium pentaurelia]